MIKGTGRFDNERDLASALKAAKEKASLANTEKESILLPTAPVLLNLSAVLKSPTPALKSLTPILTSPGVYIK